MEHIVLDGERLAYEVAFGKGKKCLDMTTGEIVSSKIIPKVNIGEGRPAVHKDVRFIRIPTLDEITVEFERR